MSLFRKPTKKIQRRVFGCDDDEEDGDPEPPPPPMISKQKKENRPAKKSTLLSFVDEEEEAEVFKVKKSTHSKRWARQKEKVKRKPTDIDSNNFYEDEPVDNLPAQEEPKPKPKEKKKVNLEGLILSGREAAAAIGSLADEEGSEEEEEDEDDRGFPRFRPESVRAALAAASGNIPDAALIHAARKTRQQARELGGADYIPIRKEKTGAGSRLVRDDGSGDEDDDEERIHIRGIDMPSDKPSRDDVEVPSDADVDSEVEQWEEQQMQKVVPAITDIGADCGSQLNPFAVPLRPAPATLGPPLPSLPAAPDNVTALHVALSDRIKELRVAHAEMEEQEQELKVRLENARATFSERQARAAPLDVLYREAQTVRGYLTDLVECLDEKMPALVALERRALALHRRRCEFVQERRRADVRDQAHDLMVLAARPGAIKHPDSEDKIRRTAEREGRRRARRMRRETSGAAHRDGDSSDDQLPPHEHTHLQAERDAIRAESSQLFADALPAWRSVRGVCRRLSSYRMSQAAYLPDCLPGLLAPHVRHELVLWNPLADEDNEDYEQMDWYRSTMMYGLKVEKDLSDSDEEEMNGDDNVRLLAMLSEDGVADDPDLMLVPTLVQKIVLPKLTELIEVAWDPMCVRSCVKLSALLQRFCAVPPRATSQLRALEAAVRARLVATLGADTFLPALPPQLSEGPGGVFWRRCLGAGVRLLRAALALYAPPLLHTDAAILSLVGTLCTAAGCAPPALAAVAATTLTGVVPAGCSLRPPTVRRAALLAARVDTSTLTSKLKEQVESLLAEAAALGPA